MPASTREADVAWPIVHVQLDPEADPPIFPPVDPAAGMMIISWQGERAVGHRLVRPGEPVPDITTLRHAGHLVPSMHANRDEMPPSDGAKVSVIVPTRDRPDELIRCLASLALQSLQPFEIVVVDNAPSTGATCQLVARLAEKIPTLRYVREPRPGLDFARNLGIRTSSGEICAFCDDDVILHRRWCESLVKALDQPDVVAVTGLVLPLELSSAAQRMFEFGWGFGRGYKRIDFGKAFFAKTVSQGCPVWEIGAGASMAFRRAAFAKVGLFDERLDAGAAGCSGDSEMWYRILAAGWTCRYEPSAISFHRHRRELAELKRQIRAYMRGHVTALFIQFQRHRDWGNLRRVFLTLPVYFLRRSMRALIRGRRTSDLLLKEEIAGSLEGIAYFARHRRSEEPETAPGLMVLDG